MFRTYHLTVARARDTINVEALTAMAIATTTQLTYADYLALPEEKRRYEIIDGVLIMPPPPSFGHNVIADDLTDILKRYVRPRRLGYVVSAPCDVLISREPLRTRQPDVLFISQKRLGVRTLRELLKVPFLETAPELVIEILSPSNRPGSLRQKIDDYCAVGVNECWVVDPQSESLEVLQLSPEGAAPAGEFRGNELIVSRGDLIPTNALPGLDARVAEIFD